MLDTKIEKASKHNDISITEHTIKESLAILGIDIELSFCNLIANEIIDNLNKNGFEIEKIL